MMLNINMTNLWYVSVCILVDKYQHVRFHILTAQHIPILRLHNRPSTTAWTLLDHQHLFFWLYVPF
jgi:hypothetical protein